MAVYVSGGICCRSLFMTSDDKLPWIGLLMCRLHVVSYILTGYLFDVSKITRCVLGGSPGRGGGLRVALKLA